MVPRAVAGGIPPPPTHPMMESCWGTLQLEVPDTRTWETRDELANFILE